MWINPFLDYLTLELNYSVRTVGEYRSDLIAFKAFLCGIDEAISWETVDSDLIRQWIVEMMDRKLASTSVNRRLSTLRSFYKFLIKNKVVVIDPVHLVRGPKKKKPLPFFLKESEVNNLLDGGFFDESFEGVRDKLIVMMFYTTGLRLSELTGLRKVDADVESMQLKVTGKRNRQRLIPFGEELAGQLFKYMQLLEKRNVASEERALFVTAKGEPLNNNKVGALVRKYLAQVTGSKKKSPHVLRHTFATSMLNNKAELESVKELLGHQSLTTTEIYTHTTFEELKKVYNKAHPRA